MSSTTESDAVEELDPRVLEFLDGVSHAVRRRDAAVLIRLMSRVTGERPYLWGASIIGFGSYHYRYESGREGDAPAAAFSPRKAATTVYLAHGVEPHREQLARLGEHTTGKGCVYLPDLERNDLAVLEEIIAAGYRAVADAPSG